jgi:type II secretion system protein J
MNKSLKGFTLLELVLSVAITAIVLLTVYSSFQLCAKAGSKAKSRINRDAAKILTQLSRDLRSAYLPEKKSSILKFSGSSTRMNFISVVPLGHNFSASGGYDLREVGYYLGQGDYEQAGGLIYRVDLTPDDDISKGGEHQQLSGLARSLKFSYYDGRLWQEVWNSTEQLPQAVRVSIEFQPAAKNQPAESFSTVVDMSLVSRE